MIQWKFISCFTIIAFAYRSVGYNHIYSGLPLRRWHAQPQVYQQQKFENGPDLSGPNEDRLWRIIPGFINRKPNYITKKVKPCHKPELTNFRRNLPLPIVSTTTDSSDKSTTVDLHRLSEEIENHPGWKVLETFDCGDSAADRIIGGTNAALGQLPWIARLGFLNYDDLDYKCGGALISDRHVLTAAHCVKSEYELATVRFGEHDTRTDPDCVLHVCAPPVQDRKVKRFQSHEKFNTPALHNDIALLELDKPLILNDYVSPICVPRGDLIVDMKLGEMVTAAGWGTMNMTTEDRADILQVVSIPIVKSEKCDVFGKNFRLRNSELCAGAQLNKDACGGDSGGPLSKIYETPEGPKNYLVGVVSFGPAICGIKKPGVYTSVSHFLPWILDRLVEFGN